MFCFDYRCDRCGKEGSYYNGIGYYRLDDGTEISRGNQRAWCRQCDTISSAERLPNRERLLEIICDIDTNGLSELQRDIAASKGQDKDSYQLEQIWRWQAELRWREGRKSPPRCLTCESTDIVLLDANSNDSSDSFTHPGCGGVFIIVDWHHASQATYLVLDSEGRHWKR